MINRRSFALTMGGVAAGMASRSRAAQPLNIGVGTFSYHSLSIDEMIQRLRKQEISEIEMSRGEFMLMKPPTAEMCSSVCARLDRAGIRCVSYYTATIKTDRDLDDAVRFARIFGAANVSGDATGRMLHRIDARFTREALTFGIHNHWFPQKFPYESADDVLGALSSLSNTVGSTLDVGQIAACGHDLVDAVRRLASRLKVVHLKDVEASGAEHNVLLGTGIVNIPAVIRELKTQGFKGLVAIEYEKEGDVDADMERQIRYARQLAG
jgi:sugar phosphate isomerase/epimerase